MNIKQNVCSDTKVVIYPNSSVYPAADPTRFAGASRHLSMHVRMSTHTQLAGEFHKAKMQSTHISGSMYQSTCLASLQYLIIREVHS